MSSMRRHHRPLHMLEVVGGTVRTTRVDAGWSQRELSRRSGVSQAQICRVERGQGRDLLISVLDRLFVALGIRYWLGTELPRLTRPQSDHVHARTSAYATRRLQSSGWLVEREVEIGGDRSRGWIDILAFRPESAVLLVIEVKTELADLGAVERSMNWYEREAIGAARRFGWQPTWVGSALLLLQSQANDARVVSSSAVFAAGFPGRAAELQEAIAGEHPGANHRFVAMVDPRSRRRSWLRATTSDGRRSPAPYIDYIDAARRLEASPSVRSVG
jgi:transcriptional regulator with XRE-family HTH domain